MVSSGRPVHLASEFLSLWIYIFLNGNSNDAGIKVGEKKRKDSNENAHLVQMVQSSFGAILPPSLWLSEKSILINNSVSCSFICLFVYLLPMFGSLFDSHLCLGRGTMPGSLKTALPCARNKRNITCSYMMNRHWQGFTVMYNFQKIIWRRRFSFKKICHFFMQNLRTHCVEE